MPYTPLSKVYVLHLAHVLYYSQSVSIPYYLPISVKIIVKVIVNVGVALSVLSVLSV